MKQELGIRDVATKLFSLNDIVLQSGNYLCVPCGYIQYFERGAHFTECLACFAGTPMGPAGFREHESEFWQLLS